MQTQHLAIDGSLVSVESDADAPRGPATGAAWAVVPSLMRAHPFTVYPAGHSRTMVDAVRENFPDVELGDEEEVSLKGGTLRLGEVGVPRDDGHHYITVAAWEGRHGCLTTSLPRGRAEQLVEAFDTLRFTDRDRGLTIDSPIVTRPRPPELIQEIEGIGVLAIRPAIATELERVPRGEGRRLRHGELFRLRDDSRALLLLGRGSVVRIQPHHHADEEGMTEVLEGLNVEWTPPATRRSPR